ncbi:DNA methyltransferase [Thermosynechococcaceae cyanobacterium Okahandja]
MRTELVWEGKYDEYGNRREVDIAGCAMPMQKIESIDEPRRAAAATGQLELFEQQNSRLDDFRNRLIWGDNKLVMASLLQEFKGRVDLIYIDPPFDVGADFSMSVAIGDEQEAVQKDQSTLEMVAYRDMWGKGTDSYLHMMYERLTLMKEFLSEKGSIYLHCDWRVIGHLRIMMDEIFNNFENLISWKRSLLADGVKTQWRNSQDFLLFYSKTGKHSFNPQFGEYSESSKKHFSQKDERAVFQAVPLLGSGRTKGETGQVWRGIDPNKLGKNGMHWLKKISVLEELDAQDLIYWPEKGGTPRLKYYLDEAKGVYISDFWDDIDVINSMASEYQNYMTQKPEKLLERIIQASSNEGDLVADFFCVRRGTRVWRVSPPSPLQVAPPNPPHAGGDDSNSLPACGEGRGGANSVAACGEGRAAANSALVPIETIQPGDLVLTHDGKAHRVLRTIHRPYQGQMVGLQHSRSEATLWLTADHKVLAKTAPRTLGGNSDWSGIPPYMRGRSRELRQNMTPPERKLWGALRNKQLGISFRRQHPIGPYVADFYSREAHLVVEVDGAMAHSSPEAIAHDANRDAYLQSLGLRTVRIPAQEVMANLEGVAAWIQTISAEQFSPQGAEWVAARELKAGDIVFWGSSLEGVPLTHVETVSSEEEVYDLEVETAHSYLTEVCAIHNCGSGTTGAVAERLGRRWIMCDLERFAIHTSRKRLIELQRKLHREGKPYRAFDVYNLGRYERQWWQKDRLQGADEEHRRVILEFFKAEVLTNPPSPLLHGRKAGAFCHVDGIDSMFTREEAKQVAQATVQAGGRECYCLAWEFEMDLHLLVNALVQELGVKLKLVQIPREIMEKNRKSPPPFLEVAVLAAEPVYRNATTEVVSTNKARSEGFSPQTRTVDIKLTQCLPSLAEVPIKERAIKSGFDFIDFWAIDFNWHPGKPFTHDWQDYRTRKDRSLKTISDAGYTYPAPGKYTACVKVVDTFGCDTSITVEVEV